LELATGVSQVDRHVSVGWISARLLVLASLAYAVLSFGFLWQDYLNADGFLLGPNQPFGGDFINLWTTARMMLEGKVGDIYRPDAFMAYQRGFLDEHIGQRLWAYPPHSLFIAWPAGLAGYFVSFAVFSLFGLAMLAAGARRFGFSWTETLMLVCSPAAMACLTLGQTGSMACGLLLMALSPRKSDAGRLTIASAVMLTVKPQIGVLLPLLWLIQRRWLSIGVTTVAVLLVVGLSAAAFGLQPWRDYIGDTLVALSGLERHGSGPFLGMIPSLFIAVRLVGFDGDTASLIHLGFALAIVAILIWRLVVARTATQQAMLVLIAICLVTPYLHVYDLTILLSGVLVVARLDKSTDPVRQILTQAAVWAGWGLPLVLMPINMGGMPLAPVVIGVVFLIACTVQLSSEQS
jgi:alpha-1,2-mannosyltransferase